MSALTSVGWAGPGQGGGARDGGWRRSVLRWATGAPSMGVRDESGSYESRRSLARSVAHGRARSHCRFVAPLIQFISDPLAYSVLLFLKRQCDRTLAHGRRRRRRRSTAPTTTRAPTAGAGRSTYTSWALASSTSHCPRESQSRLSGKARLGRRSPETGG